MFNIIQRPNFMFLFCRQIVSWHLMMMSIKIVSYKRRASISSFAFLHPLGYFTCTIYTIRILQVCLLTKKIMIRIFCLELTVCYICTWVLHNILCICFASSPSLIYHLSLVMHIFSSPFILIFWMLHEWTSV